MPDAQSAASALGTNTPPAAVLGSPEANIAGDIRGLEQAYRERDKATAPAYQQMTEDYRRDRAHYEDVAKNYTPFRETPAPQQPPDDPLRGFASIGAIFAGIASGFSHTPAIAAMNGMAGAINAAKQGDWAEYDRKYKEWKDATDIALKHHEIQSKDMADALAVMKENLAAGSAMVKAVAAQSDDKIASYLAQAGMWKELGEVQNARTNAAAHMMEAKTRVAEIDEKLRQQRDLDTAIKGLETARQSGDPASFEAAQQKVQEQLLRNPSFASMYFNLKPISSGVSNERNLEVRVNAEVEKQNSDRATKGLPKVSDSERAEIRKNIQTQDKVDEVRKVASAREEGALDVKPLTDDAADFQARMYLLTKGNIPAGFGGQAMRKQIINRAGEIAKSEGHTIEDYIVGRATLHADEQSLTAVTKQKNAAEGYERGAIMALDQMVRLIPPTAEPLNMQILTQWVRTGATEFGNVQVPAWHAALISALDQYAKVLTGSTGAQGSTDAARALALSMISEASTSDQIKGIVPVIKNDMQYKVVGYDQQVDSIQQNMRGAMRTPGESSGTSAKATSVKVVSSKAERDALPSGTEYRLPDDPPNVRRVRP